MIDSRKDQVQDLILAKDTGRIVLHDENDEDVVGDVAAVVASAIAPIAHSDPSGSSNNFARFVRRLLGSER